MKEFDVIMNDQK